MIDYLRIVRIQSGVMMELTLVSKTENTDFTPVDTTLVIELNGRGDLTTLSEYFQRVIPNELLVDTVIKGRQISVIVRKLAKVIELLQKDKSTPFGPKLATILTQ